MELDTRRIEELWACARAMADAARVETLRHFRIGVVSDNKLEGGFDPVTEGDRAAERAMRAILAQRRPDDAILGEEYGAQPGTTGLTWVLDPIDGTRAYISGAPTWGVLIAVTDAGGPVLGLIDQPYIGERFEGGAGRASMTGPMGTAPLRTKPTRSSPRRRSSPPFPRSAARPRARPFARWPGDAC